MSTNINPNYSAETETSNQLYNTQIPTLSEDANIQEALRLYHYGVASNLPQTNSAIVPQSMSGHLKAIDSKIITLQSKGLGSIYSATEPVSPDNGYVWVNANSSASIAQNGRPIVSFFQSSAPASGMTSGMIWVDSDNLSMYVYDGDSWELVSSSSEAFLAGNYSQVNMSGLGTDIVGLDAITAASQGLLPIFGYVDNITPVPLSVTVTVSSFAKNEVEFIFGFQSGTSAAGDISIARVVNGNFASPTIIGKARFSGGSDAPNIKIVDTHGQSSNTVISYVLINSGPSTITFDGDYIIQAIAREVS